MENQIKDKAIELLGDNDFTENDEVMIERDGASISIETEKTFIGFMGNVTVIGSPMSDHDAKYEVLMKLNNF